MSELPSPVVTSAPPGNAAEPLPLGKWLEGDHGRLDELWDRAMALWSVDQGQAVPLFHHFEEGLMRHMQVEEGMLFPFFEQRGREPEHHLVVLLCSEHEEIRGALKSFISEVDRRTKDLGGAETQLRNALWAHNTREEGLLYPWFDQGVSEGEGRELSTTVRSVLGNVDSMAPPPVTDGGPPTTPK